MFQGVYQGLFYKSEYDLERSDILTFLEPHFFQALDRTREHVVTHLTVEPNTIRLSTLFGPFSIEQALPPALHGALLDRQWAPERVTQRTFEIPAHDANVYKGIMALSNGQRAVYKGFKYFYVHPCDLVSLRIAYLPKNADIGFPLQEEIVRGGLVARYLGAYSRKLHVASEIPAGYVYVLESADLALQPLFTRASGIKPKVHPAHLHLIEG